ncbi:hypothetical protein BAUCODRAFT_223670 [Baudoinia panamericana UAMH 10762]|uniref:Uncharacterized protein n=1 Tax=Baudoinia panamericana (strain UAMH 10762) TaxID=717646 RepID=M2N5Z0_BAUPA|nr:uncharacterized protein BAUCODRAFT_223670 [Baudoinia panamericana UAMH 10762]EMC94195.1 hypothetical protein BAUCODRAFT_223670 [Baudoinia panamericana UAMH 10762]
MGLECDETHRRATRPCRSVSFGGYVENVEGVPAWFGVWRRSSVYRFSTGIGPSVSAWTQVGPDRRKHVRGANAFRLNGSMSTLPCAPNNLQHPYHALAVFDAVASFSKLLELRSI